MAALALVVLSLIPVLGFAATDASIDGDAEFSSRATSSTTTIAPYRYGGVHGANGFEVTLSYDEPIRCKEPVTFTVNVSGNSGAYQYKPYSLYEKGTYNKVQDFSYEPVRDSNAFTLTFDYNSTVDLEIMVYDKNDLTVFARPVFEITVDDPDSYTKAEVAQVAKQRADEVYAECKKQGFKSQYDTALWLHDWIIDHCKYDNTYRHTEASDLFLFGTGTCEAYHAAYVELLQRAGIECGRVYDNGHVWTLVKIDGEWCHVDTTGETAGNDSILGDLGRHKLFGLNDDIITAKLKNENSENEIKGKIPSVTATSLKNNYMIRSGRIHDYSDAYRSDVQSHINKGDTTFTVAVSNAHWPAAYKIIFNSLVAYQLSTEAWSKGTTSVALTASYANDVLTFTLKSNASSSQQTKPTSPGKPSSSSSQGASSRQPMYRLYNPNSGEHFYTASAFERDSLDAGGWVYEGIGWYAPASGQNVYRLYNPNAGDHHYTTSAAERDMLVGVGWSYEGVGWKSGGSVPLYRQYNPNARAGSHNFTTSKTENDWLSTMGWEPEGVAWYGVG